MGELSAVECRPATRVDGTLSFAALPAEIGLAALGTGILAVRAVFGAD